MLFVGEPPSNATPDLRNTFVLVRLPADVCVIKRREYFAGEVWWLSAHAAFKVAHDWPVGHKQVFNFGPLCLALLEQAVAEWRRPHHTWPPEQAARDLEYHVLLAAAAETDCCPANRDAI